MYIPNESIDKDTYASYKEFELNYLEEMGGYIVAIKSGNCSSPELIKLTSIFKERLEFAENFKGGKPKLLNKLKGWIDGLPYEIKTAMGITQIFPEENMITLKQGMNPGINFGNFEESNLRAHKVRRSAPQERQEGISLGDIDVTSDVTKGSKRKKEIQEDQREQKNRGQRDQLRVNVKPSAPSIEPVVTKMFVTRLDGSNLEICYSGIPKESSLVPFVDFSCSSGLSKQSLPPSFSTFREREKPQKIKFNRPNCSISSPDREIKREQGMSVKSIENSSEDVDLVSSVKSIKSPLETDFPFKVDTDMVDLVKGVESLSVKVQNKCLGTLLSDEPIAGFEFLTNPEFLK